VCDVYHVVDNYFIYNTQGKSLFEGRLNSPKTVIPTAGFARGYYLIKLKSSKTGELITTKFIIQ
ncbi:MAG TPA: T9SS type A sorting domain-containing protein, partial [Bacteroidales bacterium]|nr:T9SS type A sorting domain-containing protein [Bacteroidales bacterium]